MFILFKRYESTEKWKMSIACFKIRGGILLSDTQICFDGCDLFKVCLKEQLWLVGSQCGIVGILLKGEVRDEIHSVLLFLNVCPFDFTTVAGSGKVGPVNQVNNTSWVAVVTPTDRPKSVRNRCVIELFCDVICVVTLPFWHLCLCRGFCHRTKSDLFLFLIWCKLRHFIDISNYRSWFPFFG